MAGPWEKARAALAYITQTGGDATQYAAALREVAQRNAETRKAGKGRGQRGGA